MNIFKIIITPWHISKILFWWSRSVTVICICCQSLNLWTLRPSAHPMHLKHGKSFSNQMISSYYTKYDPYYNLAVYCVNDTCQRCIFMLIWSTFEYYSLFLVCTTALLLWRENMRRVLHNKDLSYLIPITNSFFSYDLQ